MLTRGVLTRGDTLPYAFALSHGQQGGLRTISHGGSSLGFRAHYLRFPDQRFSVIALCNTPVNPGRFAEQVAAVYLADVMKPSTATPGVPPQPAPEVTANAAELRRYAGTYRSNELQVSYDVVLDGSRLVVRRFGYEQVPLTPIGPDRFRAPIGTLEFARTSAGVVSGFRLDGGRVKRLLFQREIARAL